MHKQKAVYMSNFCFTEEIMTLVGEYFPVDGLIPAAR